MAYKVAQITVFAFKVHKVTQLAACVLTVRKAAQLSTDSARAHKTNMKFCYPAAAQFHSCAKSNSDQSCTSNAKNELTAFKDATATSSSVVSVGLDPSAGSCFLRWCDGFQAKFHSIWLRHNCHCHLCRHKNGQRLLNPADIPASLYIQSVSNQDSCLHLTWQGAGYAHTGQIPHAYLRAHNYQPESLLSRRQGVKCGKPVGKIPTIPYEEIKTTKYGLLKWLRQLNEDGLSLVTSVPCQDGQVVEVAELIGPVEKTIYGTTFDVMMTEDPINVAYSNVGLDLHMDLVYYESPPGLQLLHCLKFDQCVTGGASLFLDVFGLADEFRLLYPDLFQTLTSFPASFQKVHYDREYPVHIVNQKPHIKLNHYGDIVAVYWAPPFEGPLSVSGEHVEAYYRAYEMFAKSIQNSPYLLKHRLQPGELIIFNNLRMLHGREQFLCNGGTRHLQGCYVNVDIFKSMTQVQHNLTGDGTLAKRVGNQCWF